MSVFEFLWIIFIVLKLTGLIDWSWWAVCSPILFEIGVYIILIIAAYLPFDFCNKWFKDHDYTDLWK